ncbi:MAG: methylmalonyl Co-A mutase-associated GTPase MeaB [Candidatus Cloacimonadota bacterium]|nr:MAG: methylmalonyl Co-A mutase-associated GTPase MeaB [Candidatus Cloacimonadota bacterium]
MKNLEYYLDGIKNKNLRVLSQAITLVESNQVQDRVLGSKLLENLSKCKSNNIRIGITGTPGVGKSTFIEAFGLELLKKYDKICVLAVDPSSKRTGGSILGDKTRMPLLSREKNCFIRPTPNRSNLGGVASATKEAIILCEAFGYDVILIETVGVGQSETIVSSMVDFFLLLLLPSSGDELQGIKKGVMELADTIFINKSDIDLNKAKIKKNQIEMALHLFKSKTNFWTCNTITGSSLKYDGIKDVCDIIDSFIAESKSNKYFEQNRKVQNLEWFDNLLSISILDEIEQQDWYIKLKRLAYNNITNKDSLSVLEAHKIVNEIKQRLK